MKRFREWNSRFSYNLYVGLFCDSKDAATAFNKHPYSWLWLLVPICGIVGLYGTVWQENLDRRRAELEQRKNRNK